ncbi:MAG TPA: DUF2784 domain-containing protein [Cyclobacteriaceae bacterium]|nr:DUF2784 domain-containing protein [Cyclobacteriaceae bacterium]
MSTDFLQSADYFFMVFHTALILFNLFGWVWKPWRKAHLIVISLTFASWGLLGIWYGWGYCPLTDWHWEVLYRLGHDELPSSYISYLLQRTLDWHLHDGTVDILTLSLALVALAASVKVNFFPSSTTSGTT